MGRWKLIVNKTESPEWLAKFVHSKQSIVLHSTMAACVAVI